MPHQRSIGLPTSIRSQAAVPLSQRRCSLCSGRSARSWRRYRGRARGRLSLRCFGVADHGVHEPHGPAVVVDAVPKPSTSGDLVLPLLHRSTRDLASSQVTSQRVLALRTRPGIVGQFLPSDPGVGRSGCTDLLPPQDRCACRVSEVPPRRRRRRRDSISTLRQRSRLGRNRNGSTIGQAHSDS